MRGRLTVNRQPCPRRGGDADRAAVRVHQRVHDRQPETGAAAGPRTRRVGAVEPLEHPVGVLAAHAGPLVADLEHRVVAVGADAHRDGRRLGRVLQRVGHQVAQHLPKPGLVAEHLRCAGTVEHLHVDVALRRDRPGVVHGVAGQRQQVDAVAFQWALRVEAGQQQQVLDEQTHPRATRSRCGSSTARRRAPRLAGTARRSRGWWSAACAVRGWRR